MNDHTEDQSSHAWPADSIPDRHVHDQKPWDRSFWQYISLLLAVGVAGYLSRHQALHLLPLPIRKRTGDALWSDAIFVLIALFKPRWSPLRVACITLVISYCIEFSQIYQAPWINYVRSSSIGGLVLGATFYWLDQLAYTIGVLAILPMDCLLAYRRDRNLQNK